VTHTQEALDVAAECLAMDVETARTHSRELADDVLLVWSDRRGLGSVLVGDDLGVLYFSARVSPSDALTAFRSGRRTAPEKFAVFQRGRS
jgi:hypothetical protein